MRLGAPHGGQFLVGDHDDLLHRVEAVEHRRVRAADIEHDVPVVPRRGLDERADTRRRPPARATFRSGDASRSGPALVLTHEALEERGVEPVGVLQRVGDGEPRLGAEVDGGIAVGEVQVHQQRRCPARMRASSVATLTAAVVVPTPPFAPRNAKTSPPGPMSREAGDPGERGVEFLGGERVPAGTP